MAIAASFPSIKPSLSLDFANVGALDPRITFTRSTTGTYYDGVTTAKAEENLLTYSQEFDNAAWTKEGLTVSANNTTAPDGTSTAESLLETSATTTHRVVQLFSGIVGSSSYGLSFFIKPNGRDWVQINTQSTTSSAWANFDVTNGVVGNTNDCTASIVAAGNGWYRCIILFTTLASPSNNNFYAYTLENNSATKAPSFAGDITKGIYIWGAQLEQRSSVTAYTPTTTQPITNYIPVLQTAAAGQARFDHNPTTGEALGLLIEEQRTNLLPRSEEFSNAYWVKDKTSITANTVVAPDGTLTGDLMIATTALGGHQIYSSPISISAGNPYTYTVYAKYGGYQWMSVSAYDGGERHSWFDLLNGVPGSNAAGNTSSMTPVGNGWYRCVVTRTVAAATTYGQFLVSNTASPAGFAGDGYSGIYIWGAQLEAGAFPTSYIPTTSAQVTRNADAASMTGTNFSSWYNQGEGTLYSEVIVPVGNTVSTRGALVSDGSSANYIACSAANAGNSFIIATNGQTQASGGAATSAGLNKQVIGYATNDVGFCQNGGSVTTDTTALIPVVDRLGVGNITTYFGTGPIKKIAYYPQRLINAQLQALTA